MRSQAFDLDGKIQSTAPLKANDQLGPDAHLFSRTGYLDSSWFSRSYWMLGRGIVGLHFYPAGFEHWCEPAWFAPSARLLVFDATTAYGFGRKPEFQCNSAVYQYRLFAANRVMPADEYRTAAAQVVEQKGFHSDWALRQSLPRERLSVVKPRWSVDEPPFHARAMALAGDTLFAAGPPDLLDESKALFKLDDREVQAALAAQAEALQGERGAGCGPPRPATAASSASAGWTPCPCGTAWPPPPDDCISPCPTAAWRVSEESRCGTGTESAGTKPVEQAGHDLETVGPDR